MLSKVNIRNTVRTKKKTNIVVQADVMYDGVHVTFHGSRLVDEEVAIPHDREVHGQIAGLVPIIPVLHRKNNI